MPVDADRSAITAHSSAEHDPLERLAADYVDRLRRGERPAMAEYQQQHPQLASGIADLFPTIAALEGLREGDTVHEVGSPAQLGEFRILRELGRGGMGVVYLAEQPSLARRVALKVLPATTTPDASSRIRFQREARLSAGLSHPVITPVFAVGEGNGLPWFAMQLLHGVGLDHIVATLTAGVLVTKDNGGFPGLVRRLRDGDPVLKSSADGQDEAWLQRSLARLIAQAAEALHYAHQRGVLHRDVKPANLILDLDGRLWVNDFGLAKAVGEADLTSRDSVTGTLLYMAPERFDGVTDRRSDVYSLGLVLYELLAKRRAFSLKSHTQLIKAIMVDGVSPIRYHVPSLPQALAAIVDRACARQAERRYSDAASLAQDLMTFADSQPNAPSALVVRPVATVSASVWTLSSLTKIVGVAVIACLAWSWWPTASSDSIAQPAPSSDAALNVVAPGTSSTSTNAEANETAARQSPTLTASELTPTTRQTSPAASAASSPLAPSAPSATGPTPEFLPLLPERRPSDAFLSPVIPLRPPPSSSVVERLLPPPRPTPLKTQQRPPSSAPTPNKPIPPALPALERSRDALPISERDEVNSRPSGGPQTNVPPPPPGGSPQPPPGGGPQAPGGGGASGPRR